jgi:hypothetical protein
MFDSLDEKIKHDAAAETTSRERVVKGIVIAVLSILLFGGLYFAVRMLE